MLRMHRILLATLLLLLSSGVHAQSHDSATGQLNAWQNYTLIGGAIVLLGVGIIIYRSNKAKALANKELAEQKRVIEQALEEKEALLKEIHHRVKNNLQLVSSLLQLQSKKFKDPEIIKAMEEGQGRVKSMAIIHEMLYQNENIINIPFKSYLQSLVQNINISFGESANDIKVTMEVPDVAFNVDTAIPLGLIMNELIYNCFKYAFDEKQQGHVNISLKDRGADSYVLNIVDNGKGLPDDFEQRKSKSLGLRLVTMLSKQLEGELAFESSEKGTSINIWFKHQEDH